MWQSNEVNLLTESLSKVQGLLTNPRKGKTVSTGKYNYSYATFESIVESVRPLLSANGLCFSQGVEIKPLGNGEVQLGITTILSHVSGQWRSNFIPISGGSNRMQELGSEISYGKRYGLSSILGVVVADEDDDANSADNTGHSVTDRAIPVPAGPSKDDLLVQVVGLITRKKVDVDEIKSKWGDPRKLDTDKLKELIAHLEGA